MKKLLMIMAMVGVIAMAGTASAIPITITTADGIGADSTVGEYAGVPGSLGDDGDGATGDRVVPSWNSGAGNYSSSGLLRFDLSEVAAGSITSAQLDLRDTGQRAACTLNFRGLNDGEPGQNWDEATTTGSTAPGVIWDGLHTTTMEDTGSTMTTLLGTMVLPVVGENALVTFTSAGTELVDFLNADTDGMVTIVINYTSGTPGQKRQFASNNHASYNPPTLLLDAVSTAPPPDVIYVGNDVDVPGWRTTDVVKTLDPDGDNIYGTDGWLRPTGLVPSVNNPSYLTASYIGTGGNASTSSFGDDGVLSGLDPVADIELGRVERVGTVNDMVQLDVTADGSFRVGVMTDFVVLYAGQGLIAGPTAVRVRQTVGGADDTGMITVPVRNSVVDWMFFDILDAEVGDRYIVSVESFSNPWGWSQISHISFDTITEEDVVPEPAGLGLIGLALLAVRKKRS